MSSFSGGCPNSIFTVRAAPGHGLDGQQVADVVTNATTQAVVERQRTYAFPANGSSTVLLSTIERSVDGLRTWRVTWNEGGSIGATNSTASGYDPYRGWLASKDYPDAATGNPPPALGTNGTVYRYTAGGKLAMRLWLRSTGGGTNRLETTYTYNDAGDLAGVGYSDGTPGTTYTYDRRGRLTVASRGGITTSLFYNDANLLIGEAYSGGTLNGLALTNIYDGFGRRLTNAVTAGGSTLTASTTGFDAAGRLQTVGDAASSAAYEYLANSHLVGTLTFRQGTNTVMTTRQAFDRLNRLSSIASIANGGVLPVVSNAYRYNAANQRVRATARDGDFWLYQYDALGQLTSGRKYWPDGTPVAGQQLEYAFDQIGNRQSAKAGGDASGLNLRSATYSANRLNQYSSRTVPGAVDILGIANVGATVSVNGDTNLYRRAEYFRKELAVVNTNAAQNPQVTVLSTLPGSGSESRTGRVFVAQSPETFAYDTDGNLTADGRWTYTWDGENRLVQMVRDTDSPGGARQKLVFEYDQQGRRIRKTAYTYNNGWQEQSDLVFVYDGWNVVAELDANNANAKVRTYLWGNDLSGTAQGAGGVGGLLKVSYYGAQTTNAFVAYDGNGNLLALVDAATAQTLARYEYGPFGEAIRASGSLAELNPIRFTTKYRDEETELVYYGYRYYGPGTGRWLSRDPIVEHGGLDLYCFLGNDPANLFDSDGREAGYSYCKCGRLIPPGRTRCACGYRLPSVLPFNVGRSVFDRRPTATLRSWWDDTSFFAQNYPGCVSDALGYFERQIRDGARHLCAGQPMPNIEPYPIYGCLEDSHPAEWAPKDPPQNHLFWLGDFEFQFHGFDALERTNGVLRYIAVIVVVDKLGYPRQQLPGYLDWLNSVPEFAFGPVRSRITGRFQLTDVVDCCDQPNTREKPHHDYR
jgi:RHS repeat-associated protein